MKNQLFTIGVLSCFMILSCRSKVSQVKVASIPVLDPYKIESINTIAFGSCNHEDDDQSYWNYILNDKPDVWIWGGDNIYGEGDDMSVIKRKYDLLKNNSHYVKFRSQVPIVGTWDDHDYGQNDGNKSFEKKEESKELLLDFLDVPMVSEVRSHSGAYHSYLLGDIGRQVKILLLDTRSFQDPLKKNPSGKTRYLKGDGDLLGKEQWNWLESELYKDEAEVHLVMSSIQFIADRHGFEKWDNFPNSKSKMLEIVENSNARNVMFLSGDRHIAEISRLMEDALNYPLYDVTSSGLTHSYSKSVEKNPYRIGDLVVDKNYGLLNFNWQDSMVQIQCQLKGTEGQTYVDKNLGNFKLR